MDTEPKMTVDEVRQSLIVYGFDEQRRENFLTALFRGQTDITVQTLIRDLYVSWQQLGMKTHTG